MSANATNAGAATGAVADAPLPTLLKAGWGVGSIGTNVVLFSQSMLLLYFFTAILGLQPAVAGTLLFAAKIFDALLAPVVGNWSDRTVTRFGRRRPFLLAGSVLSALGLYAVLNPPVASPAVLFACLVVISLGYSFFNIPYLAMTAEMTDSPTERTSLMSWRIACVGVGTTISTALLPVIAKSGGGGSEGYGMAGLTAAAFAFVTMFAAFALTGRARATQFTGERFSVGAMLNAVATNRPFMYILAAKLLQLVGLAASSASMLFLIKDVIRGNENLLAVFGVTANLMSIVSMAFWPAIGRRYGKVPVYAFSVAGFAAVGFSWLLADPTTTTATVFARAFVSGIFVGGLLLMGQSLIPDAISEDWHRNGLRREGIFAGAYSFVEKAASALGPMIVGVMFQLLGFQPSAPIETQSMVPVYIAAGVIPPLAYLLSAVPVLRIRLTGPAAAGAAGPGASRPAG